MKRTVLALCLMSSVATNALAQSYKDYSPEALNRILKETVTQRLGVMVPMRDGVRLSTDIYSPKEAKGPLPTVLWKTPYNEHKLRGNDLRYVIEATKRGYVFIIQNERGRYFSEGKYEILGKPQTDGYD